MTEQEWLACTDPQKLLAFLREGRRATKRKLRLVAAALGRWAWGSLEDERCRAAVEVAEGYADGLATEAELRSARAAASGVPWTTERDAAMNTASKNPWTAAALTVHFLAWEAVSKDSRHDTTDAARTHARVFFASLLRDIFNPFRPAPVSPTWQTALEDAGCDLADLLGHLRGPGPHVRGCWAVDLLLGKG
jgi:hypothetical protein